MDTNQALKSYKREMTKAEVANADPHRLIQMLLEGALTKLQLAKYQIEKGETANKGNSIGMAISIVECLDGSLNHEAGGDIANNLAMLYDYMKRRLLEANINSDIEIIDEVLSLLNEIKAGWDGIAEEARAFLHANSGGASQHDAA